MRTVYQNDANYLAGTLFGLPLLLAFDKGIRSDWVDVGLLYLETHSVALFVYNLSFMGPLFQNKYRPLAYYDELPVSQRSAGDNRNSMYSGHTASATVAAFFMVKIYVDYHPETGWLQYPLYCAASVPPLIVGYWRVKSLDHFPSDVGVGFMVGALCGVLVPEIHRNKNKNVSVGAYSTSLGGSGLCVKWEP
jgi:membrane-associated phospholipid phosphatase